MKQELLTPFCHCNPFDERASAGKTPDSGSILGRITKTFKMKMTVFLLDV